jgi:hypothetical protein
MNCEGRVGKVTDILTPDRGGSPATVQRFICPSHIALLKDADRAGLPLMVTPITISGTKSLGGTVWINTIAPLWFGKKRGPYP